MGWHSSETLLAHGLCLPAPDAVRVADDVRLDRLARHDVVLHPGARLSGPETLLLAGARVAGEGPAVLVDVALGRGASVASGSVSGATLLAGASLGPDSQVRAGTLLEEEASTGHAVGLKQTILLPYATLGSLINFCDCLLAGGTSRKDHSEVGSGFIHFNFTPFGKSGDKATASLFGDCVRGVFLRERRIFLGGSGGVVGPITVGYGSVLAAGSVYRKDYGDDLLVYGEKPLSGARPFDARIVRRPERKVDRALRYVGELRALEAFHRELRLVRAGDELERALEESAIGRISSAIDERLRQVDRFLDGAQAEVGAEAALDDLRARWSGARPVLAAAPTAVDEAARAEFLEAGDLRPDLEHPEFVRALTDHRVAAGRRWLGSIVAAVTTALS
ncbi:MAG: UDP-N-acetylglucosamine pyrophosphorylase [Planctomycetes bacterium]|nr:UDP-N-acetylglucosamine pyrophosphorylase [Planctomycetota bacterium]